MKTFNELLVKVCETINPSCETDGKKLIVRYGGQNIIFNTEEGNQSLTIEDWGKIKQYTLPSEEAKGALRGTTLFKDYLKRAQEQALEEIRNLLKEAWESYRPYTYTKFEQNFTCEGEEIFLAIWGGDPDEDDDITVRVTQSPRRHRVTIVVTRYDWQENTEEIEEFRSVFPFLARYRRGILI